MKRILKIVKNKSEQYLSRVVYFDYPVRMTREDQHEHDDVHYVHSC